MSIARILLIPHGLYARQIRNFAPKPENRDNSIILTFIEMMCMSLHDSNLRQFVQNRENPVCPNLAKKTLPVHRVFSSQFWAQILLKGKPLAGSRMVQRVL